VNTQESYLEQVSTKTIIRVEMVCLGNICRSPLAAAILANKGGDRFSVSSSGTSGWHDGEPAHHLSERAWVEAGYSYTHTSRRFHTSFYQEADLVLAMDLTNRANLLNAAPSNEARTKVMMLRSFDPLLAHIDPTSREAELLQVPDPWGEEFESYQEVRAMLDRAIDGLISTFE
jgi:protein-tyrosine phosphatase